MSALVERQTRKRRAQQQPAQQAEATVAAQVPENRREEIRRYLQLFGYKPDSSILQVHVAGYFGRAATSLRARAARERSAKRYSGRTFVVVGRTHDPAILDNVIKLKKPADASPGYAGYLFKDKDRDEKAPDELLPLDFTPANLPYPQDWKNMFATRGFLVTMHVPSDFATGKNQLNREIRRLGRSASTKDKWIFLDDLQKFGAGSTEQTSG